MGAAHATGSEAMEQGELQRLRKQLLRQIGGLNERFNLIEPNDRVMVCVSGGKDSYAMAHLLDDLRRRSPVPFTMVCVNLDQGHPGFPAHTLRAWFEEQGYEHRMLSQDTYKIVLEKVPEGRTFCSLCSRLRRGILYNAAVELGCTKIALGHHREDLLETLLLNLFFAGQIKSMPPRLRSDDGRNTVIRPLAWCAEEDLARYAEAMRFPILPCDLCGSQENLQRKQMKALLARLEEQNPKIKGNMLAALGNVVPGHLLDQALLAQLGLGTPTGADEALQAL